MTVLFALTGALLVAYTAAVFAFGRSLGFVAGMKFERRSTRRREVSK